MYPYGGIWEKCHGNTDKRREREISHLGAVGVAVSAGVVEERSTQAFSQELPVVSQLLRTQPRPPPTPLQQELQLTLPSGGKRDRRREESDGDAEATTVL